MREMSERVLRYALTTASTPSRPMTAAAANGPRLSSETDTMRPAMTIRNAPKAALSHRLVGDGGVESGIWIASGTRRLVGGLDEKREAHG